MAVATLVRSAKVLRDFRLTVSTGTGQQQILEAMGLWQRNLAAFFQHPLAAAALDGEAEGAADAELAAVPGTSRKKKVPQNHGRLPWTSLGHSTMPWGPWICPSGASKWGPGVSSLYWSFAWMRAPPPTLLCGISCT